MASQFTGTHNVHSPDSIRNRGESEGRSNGGNDFDQFKHAGFISGPHLYCPQCGFMHQGKKDMDFELCASCKNQVTHIHK